MIFVLLPPLLKNYVACVFNDSLFLPQDHFDKVHGMNRLVQYCPRNKLSSDLYATRNKKQKTKLFKIQDSVYVWWCVLCFLSTQKVEVEGLQVQ